MVVTRNTCASLVVTRNTCASLVVTRNTCASLVVTRNTCTSLVVTRNTCASLVVTGNTCASLVVTRNTCASLCWLWAQVQGSKWRLHGLLSAGLRDTLLWQVTEEVKAFVGSGIYTAPVGAKAGAAGAGTTHSLLDWTWEKAPRSSPWE
ncbi:hypothetical protein E5288_WYG021630 [Bos mutus]|uniref:Uncharacterized protein n=1 Tax=Bos mutus TaxID=72004 RepID=A0A6B0RWM0_9CETA|nr:hypothetical protein [Bos mutus]